MGKRALGIVLAVAFALSALGAPALAGDNGQKIGQDDIRLLLTQCSNAGAGNGSEYEAVIGEILITKYFTQSKFVVVASDCLGKKLYKPKNHFPYDADEVKAILQQSLPNCIVDGIVIENKYFIFIAGGAACEIDPGNSASHNQAGD